MPPGREDEEPVAAARSRAEARWRVSVERAAAGGGLRGAVARPLRRWTRFSVEPLAEEQRAFNAAALELVDALSERLDAAAAAAERSAALVRELEERVLRLERREAPASGAAAAVPSTVAAQPAAAALPDYFAFESRMRGSTEEIAARLRPYVEDLRDAAPVLDLGCGRGELLQLLQAAGVEARGVDADADMVAYARGEGLDVEQADALAHLETLPRGSLGAVFAAQLVEHLPPPALVRLLGLAAGRLRPGGLLVLETLNPVSPLALRNYFADLTHAQPLVAETLVLLVQGAGFRDVRTRFLNEPPAAERLRAVELPDDPALAGASAALAHNVERLNAQLFAPLDYAVVARR